jgi:hypothetical protein
MRKTSGIKTALRKWRLFVLAVFMVIAALAITAAPILASAAPTPITASLYVGNTFEPGTANTLIDIRINGGPIKAGWCADYIHTITVNRTYTATIYDYFGQYYPNYVELLPASVQSVNWFAIAYIINHKIGNWEDVQNAIWYITDGIAYAPGSNTATLIANTQAYLDSHDGIYEFETGDIAPMVCYIPGKQLVFFEYAFVKPNDPLPELPTGLLFGLGLLGIGGFVLVKRHTKAVTAK